VNIPVDLKALLSEVKHIKVHERITFCGIGQARVVTDFHCVRISLINLVTDAVKYSPPDSLVLLSV
jgi:signal transduction histidine kinase